MSRKIIRNTVIAIPLVILAYLGTAAVWAAATVDELMAAYPVPTAAAALTPRQQAILLKIEDPTFFEHKGLSLTDGQGITTITSSIARDVFLARADLHGIKGGFQRFYRAVFACCKKVDIGRDAMALVLNANVSKQRQLALYVSDIYMGSAEGVQLKGLERASVAYLGKPLAQASDKEFTGLVAMIKAPNQFHPLRNPDAFLLREARVAGLVSGVCRPDGWFDTTYESCARVKAVTQ